MYLTLPSRLPEPIETLTHHYIGRDGTEQDVAQPVLNEHELTVTVNETLTMSFVCLPQYLPELVIGHLASQRLIHSAEEIWNLSFNESGTYAEVTLTHSLPETLPEPVSAVSAPCQKEWVFALADRFADGMPIHQQTTATHSCFLAIKDQILFECEDIGRHNALDKAIGYALLEELSLQDCIVYSSGRVPTDMLCKALYAGIPILVSKGAPTAKAVELARRYHMTLICAARRDRLKLFSGPVPS